jgi:protein-disulfide isomerase
MRVVSLGMTAALLAMLAAPLHAQTAQSAPLAGRSKGSASAPVTVYEMSDFQCPYCRSFALQTFPLLDSIYIATGKVRWVFINFPLTSLHENAAPAAAVALCAAKQGAFWPVHDLRYRHQPDWSKLPDPGEYLLGLADSAKISRADLTACVQSSAAIDEVRADAVGASKAGAASTPTFYIEGGLLVGAEPLNVFRRVLDSIYAVKTRKPTGTSR